MRYAWVWSWREASASRTVFITMFGSNVQSLGLWFFMNICLQTKYFPWPLSGLPLLTPFKGHRATISITELLVGFYMSTYAQWWGVHIRGKSRGTNDAKLRLIWPLDKADGSKAGSVGWLLPLTSQLGCNSHIACRYRRDKSRTFTSWPQAGP